MLISSFPSFVSIFLFKSTVFVLPCIQGPGWSCRNITIRLVGPCRTATSRRVSRPPPQFPVCLINHRKYQSLKTHAVWVQQRNKKRSGKFWCESLKEHWFTHKYCSVHTLNGTDRTLSMAGRLCMGVHSSMLPRAAPGSQVRCWEQRGGKDSSPLVNW